jgi:anti-sigma factor RsiW
MTIESLTENLTRLRVKRSTAKDPQAIARYEHHIAEVERELARFDAKAPEPKPQPPKS